MKGTYDQMCVRHAKVRAVLRFPSKDPNTQFAPDASDACQKAT